MAALNPKKPRLLDPDSAGDLQAFDGPRFFNRDLSWLEFNRRVLAQAADSRLALLDRVRFLTIFSSNLDEFYMKRVGIVKRFIFSGAASLGPDGLSPRETLAAIRRMVLELQNEQAVIFEKEVTPALAAAGVQFVRYADLTPKERRLIDEWYLVNVFPALTPLAVDPGHKFPFISNLSTNLAVLASHPGRPDDPEPQFARVKIPPMLLGYVPVPTRGKGVAAPTPDRFVLLTEIVQANLDDLFPGMVIHEQCHFRVTRSSGIQRDEPVPEDESLMTTVEAELKQRRFARAIRMEAGEDASQAILHQLMDKLSLETVDVYQRPGPLEYGALAEIADLDRPDLKAKPWRPVVPPRLADSRQNLFGALRKQDILLHHPYESFRDSVERFIATAAADPDVVTIKQTLYRTSPDSPFIQSLIRAAESGKQVACLVELRARFDEDRNVRFARQLEKAGVHVAYGVLGLKTHCKTSLVVRKEPKGLRCYAHIGTGNYNTKTAQLYTDLGLLTADPELTGDLVHLFNHLTGITASQTYHHLLVAPTTMRDRFNQLIEREMVNARAGRPARIIAKINSMEDRDVTERLYAASQAGVKITLIVRGFCCLRPAVPGLSDNIRVVSVVGRFLEHSRIFHFAAGTDDPVEGDWFIGSADWMYRNLSNRVECAAPVRDLDARRRVSRIIEVLLADHRHAWDMMPDGSYVQRQPPAGAAPDAPETMGTFATLMAEAQG